jgi:hypothetical protein
VSPLAHRSEGEPDADSSAGNGRVDPKRYVDFDLNPDLELAAQVARMLCQAGFDAALEPKFEQIHDTL